MNGPTPVRARLRCPKPPRMSRKRPCPMRRPCCRCAIGPIRSFPFAARARSSLRFRSGEFVMLGLDGRARQAAAARLFHRLAQLGRRARILFDQGARRPADLAAAAYPAGRRDHPAPETRGHAGPRRASARQAAVVPVDRHRDRPLREPRPRPRDLREIRTGDPDAHLPHPRRTRLRARTGRGPARRPADRRDGRGQAASTTRPPRARRPSGWGA
jgi:hypothetical protein